MSKQRPQRQVLGLEYFTETDIAALEAERAPEAAKAFNHELNTHEAERRAKLLHGSVAGHRDSPRKIELPQFSALFWPFNDGARSGLFCSYVVVLLLSLQERRRQIAAVPR